MGHADARGLPLPVLVEAPKTGAEESTGVLQNHGGTEVAGARDRGGGARAGHGDSGVGVQLLGLEP